MLVSNDNLIQNEIEKSDDNNLKNELSYILLTKSSFTFKRNNKGISYYISNNKEIEFDDLKKIKTPEGNKKLKESFQEFIHFFEVFQEIFERRAKNKNNTVEINLEFNRDKSTSKKNYSFNITLKYRNDEYNIINKDDINIDSGFNHLMEDINNDEFSSKPYQVQSLSSTKEQSISIGKSIKSFNDIKVNKKKIKSIDDTALINNLLQKENKYQILELKNIIGFHETPAEFIKETKNGILISGSMDNILYLYNSKKNLTKIIIDPKNKNMPESKDESGKEKYKIRRPLNIYENNSKNENLEQIIVCTKIGLISFDIKENEKKENISCGEQKLIYNKTCSAFFELNNNSFLSGGEKGISYIAKEGEEINEIKTPFRGCIKIDENIIAFTSNITLPDGYDSLIFYDIETHKIIYEIKDCYSFTISTNSLSTMETKDLFVLLCGCKKYNDKNYHKNGILLVDLLGNNINNEIFLETDDFEIYCFCPISYKINNEDIFYTDYFFAGGFSKSKSQGMVKLYKLQKIEKEIVIEFQQDIIFKEKKIKLKDDPKNYETFNRIRDIKEYYYFNRFERNVSCITQSKINGDIYITCWDGNVFLFEQPNIGFYLKSDKQEKEIYDSKR